VFKRQGGGNQACRQKKRRTPKQRALGMSQGERAMNYDGWEGEKDNFVKRGELDEHPWGRKRWDLVEKIGFPRLGITMTGKKVWVVR